MLFADKKTNIFLTLSLIAAIFCTAASAQADGDSKKSMTGIWFTASPASWIVQTEVGAYSGATRMRWELEEDANGMISGFNIWYSPSVSGGPGTRGAMCMVGARDGSRVVITESSVEDLLLPTFEFTCTHRKGRHARCLGAGFSDQPPVALRGGMTRVKDPAERDTNLPGWVIGEVRDFCSGLSPHMPTVVEPYN
jgi:hypothetical protein